MPANRDPIRLSLVEKVFRQYLQVTRTFWKEAETRAAKIIPDWKAALGDGFAQQLNLIDRQALRFGHLIATDEFVDPRLSLNDITERLAQDWQDADEKSLKYGIRPSSAVRRAVPSLASIWRYPVLQPIHSIAG